VRTNALARDLEIETAEKFSMRAWRREDRIADHHAARNRIVRMAGQDHVDSGHARGQFTIDVKAVVTEQHDQIGAGFARRDYFGANPVFLDAERPIGHEPTWVRNRRVRKKPGR